MASVRRSFSIGVTTRPPSVMSGDDVTAPKPSSVPVSIARLNMLVCTLPTGIPSLRMASPIDLRQGAALVVELTLLGDVVEIEWIGVGLVAMGRAVSEDDNVPALAQFVQPCGAPLRIRAGHR